ncbi:MAG: GGDEF domain-containing protein [Tahibacter sp.]
MTSAKDAACELASDVRVNEAPEQQAQAEAAEKLLNLQQQTVAAQARLDELTREVASAEDEIAKAESAPAVREAERLRIANALLFQAAVHAQGQADTCHETLKEVAHSVVHDSLTALPNRALFLDRLEHAIALAERNQERLAVLFIDLDRFKQINDTLGHAAGDHVLRHVAQALQGTVRDSDTVSRYGGDEFLVLLSDVGQASDAVAIADKVIAAVGVPCQFGGHLLQVKASVGISVFPNDGDDADTLIVNADAAMYLAKRHSLGSHLFDSSSPTRGGRLAPSNAAAFMPPSETQQPAKPDNTTTPC